MSKLQMQSVIVPVTSNKLVHQSAKNVSTYTAKVVKTRNRFARKNPTETKYKYVFYMYISK